MLVTSLDLSFIWALIQWDRHCQDSNFRHVVSYSFEFYGTQRLIGYMGNVQNAVYQSSSRQKKRPGHLKTKTDCEGQGRENLDLYLLCINTWWNVLRQGSSFRGEVVQSVGWWVSVMPLMLPHCLSTDKESLQKHQQRQAEAMLPHINHSHQKFTQANTVFS